ncbi:MAG: isoleucine--tRNA ligase [Candidatus Sericytochromatia bacterium]|nr:isoleucine--tRNA ligase [Candidatus Sericytochromatia bacterium]
MFKLVSNKVNFPSLEENILGFWDKSDIFAKSLSIRKSNKAYTFYDGPPFATGLPHYGHLMASIQKDIIPRYQTMQGNYVERRFGWDCHGLPVEMEVEKMMNLSSKKEIVDKIGIAEFNEACRSIVLRYTSEWKRTINRVGRWVDMEDNYKTMDLNFMESVWWVFSQLWQKGLVYEGKKVIPFSYRLGTPLSNFEAGQNYKMVQDPSIYVKFKLLNHENTYILAWTTTPWTLPSNMALAAGPNIDYVKVKHTDGNEYYLAENLLSKVFKTHEEYSVLEKMKGTELSGLTYEPLFNYFADKKEEGAFRLVNADYVSTEDGTGIVHIAPAFGEDDNFVSKIYNIPLVDPVNDNGEFIAIVTDYQGMNVKEADKHIIKYLKSKGLLFRQETLNHSYPFCSRSDTPLIYKSISTWFIKVEDVKDKMIKNNQLVHWVPEHIKDGRFGKWIANSRDWAVSRNRYWGTPIPIWKTESGKIICVGSVAELEKLSGQKITDLHMHFIDKLEIRHPETGEIAKRVTEVFDCWFESGAMPYAQNHYPFENAKHFEENFPADYIAEGLDQTRGWFYTLNVLASALFDKPAAKNIVVNGMVLAEDGVKMSKSKKNYPDPNYMFDSYGADAVRLYMINSPLVKADDLKFAEAGVKEILKTLLIPLWNSYSFFVTYANIDNWNPNEQHDTKLNDPLDKWILSSLQTLIKDTTQAMDVYDLNKAVSPFVGFIEQLTNWYIRRSRRRFWKSGDDNNKNEAYQTLYTVLLEFSKIIAPFLPFISEEIYQNLKTSDMPESVHLCDYPKYIESQRHQEVEERMAIVQSAVYMGRALRAKHQLKNRQPLKAIHLVTKDEKFKGYLSEMSELIKEELNVKEITFSDKEDSLVNLSAKANFKVLGAKLGKNMKIVAEKVQFFTPNDIEVLESGNSINVPLNDEEFAVNYGDIIIQRSQKEGMVAESKDGLTVALDSELSEELINEGLAREFINKVQTMRKESDFFVTDKIIVEFTGSDNLKKAIESNSNYIKSETLCLELNYVAELIGVEEKDVNDEKSKISVKRSI